ncbi:hypothetical protein Tsubulata_004333 [Turnera subulata]|uniref:PROP1-like PPR domain-containing protein n=1 Tax=Turnera subulata TaxID=218843 RepID=A0A9Q0FKW3_9ROSI|nr:hypothetical protein Tsubulata_004333 [Turnera subulata]
MDLTVSAKSRPLTLISCSHLLTSGAKLVRRDFFGYCGHNLLRPPGPRLRSSRRRKKCRRLNAQGDRPHSALITASLDLNSALLAVTVTALSIAYLYHQFFIKKKRGSNEVPLPQVAKDLVNRILGNRRFSDVGAKSRKTEREIAEEIEGKELHVQFHTAVTSRSVEEEESANLVAISDVGSKSLETETETETERVIVEETEGKELHVQFHTAVTSRSVEEEESGTLVAISDVGSKSQQTETETERVIVKEIEGKELHVQFHTAAVTSHSAEEEESGNLVAIDAGSSLVSEEAPLHSLLPQSSSALPLMFATEMSELPPENSGEETETESKSRELVLEVGSNPALVAEEPVSDESGGKDELSMGNGAINGAARKDLYTFFAARKPVMKTPSKVNGVKAINSHTDSSSLLKLEAPLQTAELSVQQSSHTSGGSGAGDKKFESRGYLRDEGRGKQHLIEGSNGKLPLSPSPNGIHFDGKGHHPDPLSTYNLLLRDRRPAECVALLEDMEKRGSLDMNKVYHVKFFKLCKSKKAVREAFRFYKLIPNPTLSTFNLLMSVCAGSQDSDGAFQVLRLSQEAGFKADCKLYTTLISTCAKSGKVDAMFEVFHKMANAEVEPDVTTYGALIDGCARAGQVAKAFGAYGIMRSKNVKPDRVVFNALITACGQSGAVHRAFDVLAEMKDETHPVDPDHITVGALMQACANAGQVDRVQEVYNMIHEYNIKGTPEVYTIAINCCSQTGDWAFAHRVYDDMTSKGVVPDEIFFSALIDVAGHAGKLDAAFEILREAKIQGRRPGIISYSSLMGACCSAKNWEKALELYDEIKSIKVNPTVSTLNALITALCDGSQLPKAMQVLSEMKNFGLRPNTITYSVLFVASDKSDDLDTALTIFSQAKEGGVLPTLLMCKSIVGICLRRYEKACDLGEPVVSINTGRPLLENKWTSVALMAYRETIAAGEKPAIGVISQVLGCLQLPCDASLKSRLVENLGVTTYSSRQSILYTLVDGFAEYDPRAFSLLEEAASLGSVPSVSFKNNPILFDANSLPTHAAEVYLLSILQGLKRRLAAGAKLPTVTIFLPVETTQVMTPEGEKTIKLAGRTGQAVASLLRRLGLPYQGNESYGKIRIDGISLRRWLQPKLAIPFSGNPGEWSLSQSRIGKGISYQQRDIRTGNWSLE